jgi:hypothetical protein
MARLASQTDFHADFTADGTKIPGTGILYDDYRRYDFFAERAAFVASRWPISIGKVVVIGCAYGYLVDELFKLGYDAWGVEASDFARNKAASVLAFAPANRIQLANATNRSALNSVRAAAGLSGNARFGLAISEDVLPVCTNETEAQLALGECRRITNNFLHIITCTKPENPGDLDIRFPGLLWRSRTQWRTIINAPAEICIDAEGHIEF